MAGRMNELANSESKNQRIFAQTVMSLAHSQGFYGRIIRDIEDMDETEYYDLCRLLDDQNFNDTLDVVLWLEEG